MKYKTRTYSRSFLRTLLWYLKFKLLFVSFQPLCPAVGPVHLLIILWSAYVLSGFPAFARGRPTAWNASPSPILLLHLSSLPDLHCLIQAPFLTGLSWSSVSSLFLFNSYNNLVSMQRVSCRPHPLLFILETPFANWLFEEIEVPRSFKWLARNCMSCCYCSVTKLCLTLCKPTTYSTPGSSVLHYLLEFAHIHVHWVSDAI